jgi:hypothetical protein
LPKSRYSKFIVFVLAISFWVFWNDWANFFFWLIQWQTLSDTARLYDFFNLYQLNGKWWLSQYVNSQVQSPSVRPPIGYPPTSFPFFGFFALFNFGLAAQLWLATCLSLFVVALLALAYTLKSERRLLFVSITILLFLTSYSLRIELGLGQINLLIASLTVLSLVCERVKHPLASAVLLSIGTLLKGPPVLFLIYFVVFRRDLRYLVNFLVCTLGIVAVSLFVVPIQWYLNWILNVAPTLTRFMSAEFASITGMGNLTPIIFFAGICLLAVFAFYVNSESVIGSGKTSLRADAMFLMISLVMLLVGRTSYYQDYVWVLLPMALFLSGLMMDEIRTAYIALVAFATFLMNATPYPIFMYYAYSAMTLPTLMAGNLIMVISLIALYMRPNAIFRNAKRDTR